MSATQAPPPPNPHAAYFGTARHIDRHGLVAASWTCLAAATCFVGLRLVVRWRQNHGFLADDYWMVWGWSCVATMAALQTVQQESLWYLIDLTAGRISPQTPEEGLHALEMTHELTKWQYPIITLFWISLWSVKASFMAVFYRLVKPFPVFKWIWYGVAVFVVLSLIGCITASTLTCDPPSDYFYGSCDSPREQWRSRFNIIFSTTVDITSDLLIMAIPIALLPKLQLDTRKKVGLGIAFSLGVIIIAAAIARMTQVILKEQVDLVGLALWGAVETAISLIVGSLPPLKALITRGVKKYSTKQKSSQRYGSSGKAVNSAGLGGSDVPYGPTSTTRSVMVAESLPLDDMHMSKHQDGQIYVQKTFNTKVENFYASSTDEEEIARAR